MKTHRLVSPLLTLAAAFVFTAPVFADGVETPAETGFAPQVKPLSAYAHLDKKSPFEFDPPPEKKDSGPDPFEGVSLAGYCGTGNTLTVYIISGVKEKKRMSVYGDGSPYKGKKRDDSGFRVIGINRGKSLKTTTVTLEKDGVKQEIAFEEDTLRPKGGPAPGQNIQMVPGANGQMVPRQTVQRPSNSPGALTYQAPPAFNPGQGGNQHQQQQGNQPGVNVNNGQPQPQFQTVGTMNNQQLVNSLVGANGQPQVPNVSQSQGGGRRGDQPPLSVPPQRRRVVLPTAGTP